LERISRHVRIVTREIKGGENLIIHKTIKRIAVIGGTGREGKGLAYRWCIAGYSVIIGSRDINKAQSARSDLLDKFDQLDPHCLEYALNEDAVSQCEVAVLTIPYQFHKEMILNLKPYLDGKYLIDVTVPLVPPKVSVITIPPDGSAALHAQNLLGDKTKVISAFQNISFELLLSQNPIDCDVLVCGTDKDSREMGMQLVKDAGLVAWDAGPLENSIISEGLTSILIRINKEYGTHTAGIQITGVPRS